MYEERKRPPHISTIFGIEVVAIVLAIYRLRATLRNRAIVIYTDNNAALAALINAGGVHFNRRILVSGCLL